MAMDLPGRRAGMGGVFALSMLAFCSPGMSSEQMHQPTFQCANAGALRVICIGNFIDGSSAAGVAVRVFDNHDRVVYVGTVDSQGRITFRKPAAEFHIVFDDGQGNVLTILGSEMT